MHVYATVCQALVKTLLYLLLNNGLYIIFSKVIATYYWNVAVLDIFSP